MARRDKAQSVVELVLDPQKFLQDMEKLAKQTGQTLATTISQAVQQGLKTASGARPVLGAGGNLQGFRGSGGRMVSGAEALGMTPAQANQWRQQVNTVMRQERGRLQVAAGLAARTTTDILGKTSPAGSVPFSSPTMQSRLGVPILTPGQTMAAMAGASKRVADARQAAQALAQSKLTTPEMLAQLSADRRAMASSFMPPPPPTQRQILEQKIASARAQAQTVASARAAEDAQYPFRGLGRVRGPMPGQSWSHWASTQFPNLGAATNYQNMRQQAIDMFRGNVNPVSPQNRAGMSWAEQAAQQFPTIGDAPNGTNQFGRNLAGSAAANNLNNPANRTIRQAVSPQRMAFNVRQNRLGLTNVAAGGAGASPTARLATLGAGGFGGGAIPPTPPTPPAGAAGPSAFAQSGGITKLLGNIGGVVGSAMLFQQAFAMHDITTKQIQRTLARTTQDAKRDVKELDRDWDATMVHYKNAFKDINEDRTKAQRNFDQNNKDILQHEQRALEDNQQQRVEMNQQALRMQVSMQRQQEDYTRDLRYAQEDYERDYQATYRQEFQVRRNYEREIASIKLGATRRQEDYEHDINNIVRDRDRFQRDVNKRASRDQRDLDQFEAETEKKRQKQLDEAKDKRGDLGLDQAIAGLGMIQAMRQGGLMGILQAYKQYKNVQDEMNKNEDVIARGGLTEEQQNQIDKVRQGFADKAQDLIDDVTDFNANMLDRVGQINQNYARGVADDAERIKQAGENEKTALDEIDIKRKEIDDNQVRRLDAINQANDRFWIDMGMSITEWRTGWAKIETQVIRIEQDAQNQRMKNATDFKDSLDALDRVERDAIIAMGQALIKDTEARDKIREHLKRALEDAKTQQDMADEQLKMGIAFNILFSGMALKNLRDAIGQFGLLANTLKTGSGAMAVIGGGLALVAGIVSALIGMIIGGGIVQLIHDLTGGGTLKIGDSEIRAPSMAEIKGLMDAWNDPKKKSIIMDEFVKAPWARDLLGVDEAIKQANAPTKPEDLTNDPSIDKAIEDIHKTMGYAPPKKKQHGGIVSEPAMLIGLRSNRFLGTVAEKGPEVFSPTSNQYMRQIEDMRQNFEQNRADIRRLQVDVNVDVNGYSGDSVAFERALEDAIGKKIIEFIEYDGKGAA